LILGEHATKQEVGYRYRDPLKIERRNPIPVPVFFPDFTLNPFTVRLFNEVRYLTYLQQDSFVEYEPFFYPLDFVGEWNRIYGKRGFTQYQFVLPKESSREGLRKILTAIAGSGEGSFLAVLKLFGKQEGMLSFPKEGYTLALDFAITPAALALFPRLDALVDEYGGRLYLTKDVRMERGMFEKGYAHGTEAFRRIKHRVDPGRKFQSMQSKRIGL
ncbi:MAG: FAD-binding oxidoreductase, partial [Bacteroidetes bacterium]|nr:FAD-binding oxidoreductase [Bacteroidota bacterium]